MANQWFRLYAEFVTDPKVQMMSEAMQRRLVMLMGMRCSNNLETLHETEIAFQLRISEVDLVETKALFIDKGFIDDKWNLINWDKRQFASDTSTERVRAFREKKKLTPEIDETEAKRSSNALEQNRTEQIQNRTEQKKSLILTNESGTQPVAPSAGADPHLVPLFELESTKVKARSPDDYVTFWNKNRDTLSEVKTLSHERRRRLQMRITNGLTPKLFRDVIAKVHATPFCLGDNDRTWRVDLDFLIANDTNYLKVLEGKYDTAAKPKPVRIVMTNDLERAR